MKRQSRQSAYARSSSINNYNAQEIATRLSESVSKAAEEARQEGMHKKIDEDVAVRLTSQFTNPWAQKEAALQSQLAVTKAAQKRELKKNQ